ncbi:alpha/beta fold hydrolase [Streptomyces griseocarneus]|uniref:Alpha/beta fold hydrolase n=1 Tax=Streptomyces griseocarneus TaxID=51201 RepID=A0ABX7RNZ4_9ACTN|nr:alpha/beta fold hydrolase [Streptomyces griseocarneus]QSY49141.1 alpha/beta fold hydrolase [Streptomyces griseocarneus]
MPAPTARTTAWPRFPFASQWFDHPDARMHYVDEGTGPPVLMVHGNPAWSYIWRHLVTGIHDAYRCVAPDLLGMGLTQDHAPLPASLLVGSQVAALDDLVDHLIAERGAPEHGWTVIGHDWGGPIALTWACLHPDRVDRLVALNTLAFPFPADGLPPRWFRLLQRPCRARWPRTTPPAGYGEPPAWAPRRPCPPRCAAPSPPLTADAGTGSPRPGSSATSPSPARCRAGR